MVVWLIAHTPTVEAFGEWNNWGIALTVCFAIDFLSALGAKARGRRPVPPLKFDRPGYLAAEIKVANSSA